MGITLTPQECRKARKALGITQRQCSSDTGLNLSHLSLFECEKKYLENSLLGKLLDYFKELGYELPDRDYDKDSSYFRKMEQLAKESKVNHRKASVPSIIEFSHPPDLVKLDPVEFYLHFGKFIDSWLEMD